MKNLGLLLGFAPLVVYGVLSGSTVASVVIALAAAVITTVLVSLRDLRQGMLLPWTNLCLFGSALLVIGLLGMDWIIPYMGILIYTALAVVTFGSILAGRPFTLEYARNMVEPAVREHPLFFRANLLMTGVWGMAFVVNLVLSMAVLVSPPSWGRILQYLTYAVLLVTIVFTIRFPSWIRKRHPLPGDSPE